MKKILLLLAVIAFVATSCGLKTNAQDDTKAEETTTEVVAAETEDKACCEKDSTAACCEKDSTKACCEKDSLKTDEVEAPEEAE
ncbi:hypothetical protein [Carboxylicivirga linearis]|uniref:Lipoprotein n=1 Tax=Carboxylicivirga linearis TaxID=1628157 RepID=A0ABS5JXD3_9BACT|nr:hypothetical protein [Carboxylicivirga linearis]MBS2099547.1 hypothetical protein [Carboxylicivirga linearis]